MEKQLPEAQNRTERRGGHWTNLLLSHSWLHLTASCWPWLFPSSGPRWFTVWGHRRCSAQQLCGSQAEEMPIHPPPPLGGSSASLLIPSLGLTPTSLCARYSPRVLQPLHLWQKWGSESEAV